jgi:hypothetical protein
MCAKCKLQLGEHLLNHQAQNSTNKIDISNDTTINHQCQHNESDSLQTLINQAQFDDFTSKDLIDFQKVLRDSAQNSQNLIKNDADTHSPKINQVDAETFLIDNGLHKPLLNIANKRLGRQQLNFDQLTPPEQKLWNLFEKCDIYKFLTGEKDTVPEFCHNFLTFSASLKVNIDTSKIAEKLVPIPQHKVPQAIQRSFSAPSPPTHNL